MRRLGGGESMKNPSEWFAEAGLQDFVATRVNIRCAAPHVLIPLADIEKMMRVMLFDANGFRRRLDETHPIMGRLRTA
jgi:hypothetical protein